MPASLGTATPRPTGPKPLFYGWDNPESSWLRTHPATAERIHRLLKLAPAASASPPWLAFPAVVGQRWNDLRFCGGPDHPAAALALWRLVALTSAPSVATVPPILKILYERRVTSRLSALPRGQPRIATRSTAYQRHGWPNSLVVANAITRYSLPGRWN